MEPGDSDREDIQARVLQNTLIEIASEKNISESADDVSCCVICLDNVSEPCVAQPCHHHNFDFICLVSWLQERPSCPLCKADVREVRYEFSDDEKSWKTYAVPVDRKDDKSQSTSASAPFRQVRPVYERSHLAQNRRRRDYAPQAPVTPDEAIVRRRAIYRDQLYSLHVGSNRISQYRDLTPQLFESDANLVSRARMWIRRELQVFGFLSINSEASSSADNAHQRRRANNAEFLLEYIIAILKTVDIQGSCGQAEDMLQEFLGRDNTRLFLHELRSWLRSPYTSLETWDRNVQYDTSKKVGNDGRHTPEQRQSHRYGRAQRYRPRGGHHSRVQRYKPYSSSRPRDSESQQEAVQRYVPD